MANFYIVISFANFAKLQYYMACEYYRSKASERLIRSHVGKAQGSAY